MGKYNAATGLGKMYYTVLKEKDGVLTPGEIKDVDYVQELEIEFGEDLEKAYGSNKVAEIAKSAGETSLNLTFHKLPIDVQKDMLGLVSHSEKENVYGFSNGGGIDYVAVAIPRTMEDGSMEWFGLSQGVFTRPKKEGKTKEDKVEFGSDEIEGQFMERQIPGFEDAQSVLMTYDQKGSTEGRDEVFKSIFGKTLSTNESQGQTTGAVTAPQA